MLIPRGGKVDQLTWHGDWGTKKKDGKGIYFQGSA